MRVRSLVIGAAAVVTACAPPRAQKLARGSSPIIGGTTDDGHPAVVLIENSTAGFLCSGTIIAPNVVLTAAHCTVTDDTCVGAACVALAPNGFTVLGGTDPFNAPDFSLSVSEVHFDPNYDGANFSGGDLGILVLADTSPVTPMAVLHASAGSDAMYVAGTPFLGVGFGLANSPTGPDTTGTKRVVSLTITSSDAVEFRYGSSTKNTCEGDSGGPAIVTVDGVDTVIGTVSYGDNSCKQFGANERTDTEDTFISTYAPASSTVPTPTPSSTATPVGTSTSPDPTPTPDGNNGGGNTLSSSPGGMTHGCDVGDSAADGACAGLFTLAALALASRKRWI